MTERLSQRLGAWSLNLVVCLILLFIMLPIVIPIIVSFSSSEFLSFPPEGFSLRWYHQVLQDPEVIRSFQVSVQLALISTIAALLLGTVAALVLDRNIFLGREAIQTFLLSPLIFPSLVTGIALLQFFAMMGSNKVFLHLAIAHTVVILPYVVRTVSASLQMMDRRLEEASRTLGRNSLETFWYVTFPLIRPGIIAGGIFAFVTSFDNFTVSMWLSNSETFPIPLLIFTRITISLDPSVAAISGLLILMSIITIVLMERIMGLQKSVGM